MSVNSLSTQRAKPRKRPAQERSRRTYEAILDAAAHVFAEHGYAATTTNHVAAAADVSYGSRYQYFPSKDALLVALEERHLEGARLVLTEARRRWSVALPDAAAWARSFVDTLVEINGSPVHVTIYDTAPPLPHLESATTALVDDLAGDLAGHLRRWGHGDGARLRARLVVVMALRLVHDVAIRTEPGAARRRVAREIARLVCAAAVSAPIG